MTDFVKLARGAAEVRRAFMALKPLLPQKYKKRADRLDDETRRLFSALNVRACAQCDNQREPPIQGVEYTSGIYQTQLVPSDDILKEGA